MWKLQGSKLRIKSHIFGVVINKYLSAVLQKSREKVGISELDAKRLICLSFRKAACMRVNYLQQLIV
jgi:hypothetical protein